MILLDTVPYIYIYMEHCTGKWVLWISFYNIKFKSIYLPKYERYRVPIFNTTYHNITILENPFWCLTHTGYRRYKVRYTVRFKTATSPGRSVQICSNSIYTCKGPVAIDLLCLLIFTLSVTGIQLCKVIAYFPVVSRH